MNTEKKELTDNEYASFHQRLKKKYGKALLCESTDCSSKSPKRFEWALRKGHKYSDDKADYIQLCPSCHRKYDYTDEHRAKQSTAKIGRPANHQKPVDQFTIDGVFIRRFDNITLAAKSTGATRSVIVGCLMGRYKTSNGFIWKRAIMN